MTYVAPTLSPDEIAYFDTLTRRLGTNYADNSAWNLFNRGVLDQNFGADLEALQMRLGRQREQLPGTYAGRGLLNSGIYHQGLRRHAEDAQTATNDLSRRYQQSVGANTLKDLQNESEYFSGFGDTESSRYARRASTAANLRSVR